MEPRDIDKHEDDLRIATLLDEPRHDGRQHGAWVPYDDVYESNAIYVARSLRQHTLLASRIA